MGWLTQSQAAEEGQCQALIATELGSAPNGFVTMDEGDQALRPPKART